MSDIKCEDRINSRLKSELFDMKASLKDLKDYRKDILSITKNVIYDIKLSWGGPEDGFLVEVDPDYNNDIVSIEYYYKDWMDGAKRELRGDDFRLACTMFGPML